jgi:hypothetical protein
MSRNRWNRFWPPTSIDSTNLLITKGDLRLPAGERIGDNCLFQRRGLVEGKQSARLIFPGAHATAECTTGPRKSGTLPGLADRLQPVAFAPGRGQARCPPAESGWKPDFRGRNSEQPATTKAALAPIARAIIVEREQTIRKQDEDSSPARSTNG